jgi:ferrous iron transport protein B
VGNPNVGKSVVFHYLTGKYAAVSNYPGTTVEVTHGKANLPGDWEVVDTPGLNSLLPHSEDERVARDIILEGGDQIVVQVCDAKNLRRALVVTSQLAQLGIPFVMALNMWDEAQQRGIQVDTQRLSQILGLEVVETVAVQGRGLSELKAALGKARPATPFIRYDPVIEEGLTKIVQLLPPLAVQPRGIALLLLSGDKDLRDRLLDREAASQVNSIIQEVQSHYADPLSYVLGRQREARLEAILAQVLAGTPSQGETWANRLGQWTMHPLWGIPILLAVLYLVFYLVVGQLGAGVSVDFLESVVFGEYINVWATQLLALVPIPLVRDLLVGPYGLITMGLTYAIAIVLPIVGFFFLAFGTLEDAGYLPRLAIMVNRVLRVMGLSGKAVVPMVLGLGCVTMATLTTRILETKRERVIATLLLALAIPCSAQLGVILGMLSSLSAAAFGLFFAVILSQLLLVGFMASKLLPGETSDFLMEIPPLRVPHFTNVLRKTLYALQWFLREAVPLFLLGTFLLFLGDKIGLLALLETWARPVVVGLLGLPPKAAEAFIMGFLRRDYGAAGLFSMQRDGLLDVNQALVSLVVITLFVPCIANFFVIIKERGIKTALLIVGFVFPFAILVGSLVNLLLRWSGIQL